MMSHCGGVCSQSPVMARTAMRKSRGRRTRRIPHLRSVQADPIEQAGRCCERVGKRLGT